MSIINETLKSLEKDKQRPPMAQIEVPTSAVRLKKTLSILLGFIVLVVIILAIMVGIQKLSAQKPSQSNLHALQHHTLKPLNRLKAHAPQQPTILTKHPEHSASPLPTSPKAKMNNTLKPAPKTLPHRPAMKMHPKSSPVKPVLSIRKITPPSPYQTLQTAAAKFTHAGNVTAAIQLLTQQTPVFSQYPDYYAQLAYLYLRAGQCRRAISLYQQLTSLEPDDDDWWLGLASAYMQCQDDSRANSAYQTTLKYASSNAPYRDYLEQKIAQLNA